MQSPGAPPPPAPPGLRRAQSLARVLDTAIVIPGTRFRIGLDPIVGLIPGFGDVAGVLLSISILVSAARLGVPRATLLRMSANVALEAVIGTIPLLGDVFDAGWKANVRNVRLMEARMSDPERASRLGNRWLVATAAGLGAVLVAIVGGAAWLIVTLLQLLGFD